ncbi:MAG: hypothetical protein PHT88_01750 [Candidatus Moranbacteria bacterium]|nr:hypothetical protein [Candidatus Moranbacteria bacterium]
MTSENVEKWLETIAAREETQTSPKVRPSSPQALEILDGADDLYHCLADQDPIAQ